MGKRIDSIASAKDSDSSTSICNLIYDKSHLTTDEFEVPYEYTVLMHYKDGTNELHGIEILDFEYLIPVIDNQDCLPDIGLLDYGNMKDKTLREIYKELITKSNN